VTPTLSVIVPVHDDPIGLEACLTALAGAGRDGAEVIVVDDASTDATPEVARRAGAHLLRLPQRSGPAAARNRGVEAARAGYVLFLDADVRVHPDTLARVEAGFASDARIDALFGSYDRQPAARNLLSQYKNLVHHHVHQQAREEASTFWAGCGAVRRSAFLEVGGFDARYTRPCIEDIELGARLRRAGHRIVVRKDIQVTHLKRWTLPSLVMTDVWSRGVPWGELVLQQGSLPDDLNLSRAQRVSATLSWMLFALLLVGARDHPWLLAIPPTILSMVGIVDVWSSRLGRTPLSGLLVLGLCQLGTALGVVVLFGPVALAGLGLALAVVLLNWKLYAFFARERHPLFLTAVFPLQLLYYGYSVLALTLAVLRHLSRRFASSPL